MTELRRPRLPPRQGLPAFAAGLLLLLPLLSLMHPGALAAPASSYVADAGGGRLQLLPDRFKLNAVGVNGHSCTLDGPRKGSQGDAGEGCLLQFKTLLDGSVEVAPASEAVAAACRLFCGARASFEDVYHPTPAGCEDAQRQARRAQALQAYKAGRHAEAAAGWAGLERSCGALMHWTESYALANDRAVVAYHLGDYAACASLSRPVADEQQLKTFRETAPTDHEHLLPLYRAARFNLQRCDEKAAARR